MDKKVVVAKGAFAQQTAAHFPWIKFWGVEYKSRKFNEINSLLDSCIADGLIEATRRDGDGKIFIKNSFKGEDFYGHADFLEAFLSRYNNAWTRVVVPMITFVAGILATYLWPRMLHGIQNVIGR